VGLNRPDAEGEPPCDLLVAEARAEETQYLGLTRCQPEAVAGTGRHGQGLLRRHQTLGALREREQRGTEVPRRLRAGDKGIGARSQEGAQVVGGEGAERHQRAQVRLALLQTDEACDPIGQPDLIQEDQRDRAPGIGLFQVCLADRVKFRHVLQSGANSRAQVLRLIQDQDANGRTHDLAPFSPDMVQVAGIEGQVPRTVPVRTGEY
jgi:hypothetical protein